MQKITHLFLLSLGIALIAASCQTKDYEALKKEGLASGKRYDDFLFGIKLGMERQAFYDLCLSLNQEGKVTNGPLNTTVLYVLPGHEQNPIDFNFYPDFCQNKICKIKASFNYQAWAPWNRDHYAEKLLPTAKDWLENHFKTKLNHKVVNGKNRLVSIDGNREIMVWIGDERFVTVHITDITATPDQTPQVDTSSVRALWQKAPSR